MRSHETPLNDGQIQKLVLADSPTDKHVAILIALFGGIIGEQLIELRRRDFHQQMAGIVIIKKNPYTTLLISPDLFDSRLRPYMRSAPADRLFCFSEEYLRIYLHRLGQQLGIDGLNMTRLQATYGSLFIRGGGTKNELDRMLGRDNDDRQVKKLKHGRKRWH